MITSKASISFWGSWGSIINWLEPKTKLPELNLTKLSFSKPLYFTVILLGHSIPIKQINIPNLMENRQTELTSFDSSQFFNYLLTPTQANSTIEKKVRLCSNELISFYFFFWLKKCRQRSLDSPSLIKSKKACLLMLEQTRIRPGSGFDDPWHWF